MSCCGQKRAALSFQQRSWNRQATPNIISAPPNENGGLIPLRYLGSEPLSISGPYSGRLYSVGHLGSAITADPLDVQVLLSTLLFAHADSALPDDAQTSPPNRSAQAEE